MTDPHTDVDAVSRQIADQVATRARDAMARATQANHDLETAQSDTTAAQRRATAARNELRAAVRDATAANVTAEHLANLGIDARAYRNPTTRPARKRTTSTAARATTN